MNSKVGRNNSVAVLTGQHTFTQFPEVIEEMKKIPGTV